MSIISIVIPCFNEKSNIKRVFDLINQQQARIKDTLEVIFVDDGSTDGTLSHIRDICREKKASYLSLSKNFGHQIALKCGFDNAQGDAVITMDADLQHPPHLIPKMIEKWREGVDIVNTTRLDPPSVGIFKKISSRVFYAFFSFLSGMKMSPGSADFRLLDRKVVNELKGFHEPFFFLRGIITWIGFRTASLEYQADERFAGKSKYTLRKMIRFAMDGIMSFSIRPLRLAGILGLFIFMLCGLYILYVVYTVFFTDKAVVGWASIVMSILFMGGIQLIFMGLLGEYLGKLFIENKRRPVYIVKEKDIVFSVNPEKILTQ